MADDDHMRVGFVFHGAQMHRANDFERKVMALLQHGHVSFSHMARELDTDEDTIVQTITGLDKKGILTIEWPPGLKNKLN